MTRLYVERNRKENKIKQTKKGIARFLETGEDQIAMIMVENFITEEKIMYAYEEVEIFCRLILAGLDTIDTQKDCPTNLKEAVTGVVFASTKLGEITELMEIRKHFELKYGKKCVKSLLEDIGKSSIVGNLTEITFNTEIKVKALTSIAAEHGIRWNSKLFQGQFKQQNGNLMDGTSSFGTSHEIVAAPKMANSTTNTTKNDDEASTSRMGDPRKLCNDNSVLNKGHPEYKKSMMGYHDGVKDLTDVNEMNLSSSTNNLEFLDQVRNENSSFVSDSTDNKEKEYQKSLELNSGSEVVVKDVIFPKNKDKIDQEESEEKGKIIRHNLDLENNFDESVLSSSSDNVCKSNVLDQGVDPMSSNPGAHCANIFEPKQIVTQSDCEEANISQEIYDIGHDSENPKDLSLNNAVHNNVHSQIDSIGDNNFSNVPAESKPSQIVNKMKSNTLSTQISEKALTSFAADRIIKWYSKSSEKLFKQHDQNLMDGTASSSKSHEMGAESSNSQSYSNNSVKCELTDCSGLKSEENNIHQLMLSFKDAAEAAEVAAEIFAQAAAKAADKITEMARTATKIVEINSTKNADKAQASIMEDSRKICNASSSLMVDVNGINFSSGNNNLECLDKGRNQNSTDIKEECHNSLKINSGSKLHVNDVKFLKDKGQIIEEDKDAIISQSLDLRQKDISFLQKETEDDLDDKESEYENSIKSVSSDDSDEIYNSNGLNEEINIANFPTSFNSETLSAKSFEPKEVVSQSDYNDTDIHQEISDEHSDKPVETKPFQACSNSSSTSKTFRRNYHSFVEELRRKWMESKNST